MTQKTNVYFCPCGLLEVAIPIVVRGHYLGGFIGGQIRCNDAPESISQLAAVMHSPKANEVVAQNKDLLEVAFYLGYNESSYFSKVFKKFEKMTVKQYKSRVWQKNLL